MKTRDGGLGGGKRMAEMRVSKNTVNSWSKLKHVERAGEKVGRRIKPLRQEESLKQNPDQILIAQYSDLRVKLYWNPFDFQSHEDEKPRSGV